MSQKLLSIGECMVEFAPSGNGLMRRGFAGDTFNAAWYARAALPTTWTVDYLTAVGRDTISDAMLAFMEDAGIGTSCVRRVAGKVPGLYVIDLEDGERSFTYWRSDSAARSLADDETALRAAIDGCDAIYFSGVTLAILRPEAAGALLATIGRAKRAGKVVAFDPNIRPALWASDALMRRTVEAATLSATWVMPSFEEEARHFGDRSIAETLRRHHDMGVANVLVKDGARGAVLSSHGEVSAIPAVGANVVDTTGAGDSFNGAFLARLLAGDEAVESARFAAAVAAVTVSRYGALPTDLADLTSLTAIGNFNVK